MLRCCSTALFVVRNFMRIDVFVCVLLQYTSQQLVIPSVMCVGLSIDSTAGQVSLTANATLDGALCPGSVQFTCMATQQAALRWRFNNTVPNIVESAYTVDSSVPSLATPMPGVTVELVSRENIVNQTFADFTSTLTVDISVLRDDVVRSISCGSPANTTVLDIPMLTVQGWLISIMSV